jgi:hypothetical protein
VFLLLGWSFPPVWASRPPGKKLASREVLKEFPLKMWTILSEFKKFALRGNVVD